jgi:hypothetical protein
MNKESEKILPAFAEPYLLEVEEGKAFQLMRIGYYKKSVTKDGKLLLSEIVSLKDKFNK